MDWPLRAEDVGEVEDERDEFFEGASVHYYRDIFRYRFRWALRPWIVFFLVNEGYFIVEIP